MANLPWYQVFKEKLPQQKPELANRTQKEVREKFDELSEKIMEGYDFKTPEEMEHFMRREEIDPR